MDTSRGSGFIYAENAASILETKMNSELFDYLAGLMPAAPVECAGCGKTLSARQAIVRDGKFFHSTECAEKHFAPMIKPVPKGHTATMPSGAVWDV